MDKELEVKVLNISKDEIERKLLDIGACFIVKEHQKNYLIDSKEKSLHDSNGSYLRLRETMNLETGKKKFILTLKQNISNEHMRENIEVNSEIENKESIVYILDTLGYKVVQEGHKERTSYQYENIRFDIDTWDKKTYPYTYMEIEVSSKEDLEKAIDLLNIDKKNVTTKSIIELRNDLGM